MKKILAWSILAFVGSFPGAVMAFPTGGWLIALAIMVLAPLVGFAIVWAIRQIEQ